MRRIVLIAAAALAGGPAGCAAYSRLAGGYPAEGTPTPAQAEWMRVRWEMEQEQRRQATPPATPAGEAP